MLWWWQQWCNPDNNDNEMSTPAGDVVVCWYYRSSYCCCRLSELREGLLTTSELVLHSENDYTMMGAWLKNLQQETTTSTRVRRQLTREQAGGRKLSLLLLSEVLSSIESSSLVGREDSAVYGGRRFCQCVNFLPLCQRGEPTFDK